MLETERLVLRPWTMEDIDDFFEYAKDSNVGSNLVWEPHKSKEVSSKMLLSFTKDDEIWAIVFKEDNKVIGSLRLHSDSKRVSVNAKMVDYVLSADYWGRGIMTESIEGIIKYAFESLKIDVLSIYHKPSNILSKRVIEKSGFKHEGILRHANRSYDGHVLDNWCYSILRSEYNELYRY